MRITLDVSFFIFTSILYILQVEVSAELFQLKHNTSLLMDRSPVLEENVTSVGHCAQLCAQTSACVSANYDTETSSCHLIDTINTWKSETPGKSALIKQRYVVGGNVLFFYNE